MAEQKENMRSASDFLPERRELGSLRRAARECQGCDLYKNATQTVFGAGKDSAPFMLVGEVPGDQEDLTGQPFVGLAGKLLRLILDEVGIRQEQTYVTNVVKHFKWEPRGKRRMHAKPSSREVAACRPWLQAEIEAVHPDILVCLGATAAQALLGRRFRITRDRGKLLKSPWARWTIATYHPSAILRAPEEVDRHRMRDELAADLRLATRAANLVSPSSS